MLTTRNFAGLLLAGCTGLCLLHLSGPAHAYPLDGYESTGIGRLEAQRLVQEGTVGKTGKVVATMGTRDNTAKLHFEIRRDGKPVDPLRYLPAR